MKPLDPDVAYAKAEKEVDETTATPTDIRIAIGCADEALLVRLGEQLKARDWCEAGKMLDHIVCNDRLLRILEVAAI
ncbi:MAG: hypothetical protein ACYCRF_12605 [Acidithiobacillus sp.]